VASVCESLTRCHASFALPRFFCAAYSMAPGQVVTVVVCCSHARKLAFPLRSFRSLLGCAGGLDVLQVAGVLYCSSCSSTAVCHNAMAVLRDRGVAVQQCEKITLLAICISSPASRHFVPGHSHYTSLHALSSLLLSVGYCCHLHTYWSPAVQVSRRAAAAATCTLAIFVRSCHHLVSSY
jgi:hypothetical protein